MILPVCGHINTQAPPIRPIVAALQTLNEELSAYQILRGGYPDG
jgi:hypothetical protein